MHIPIAEDDLTSHDMLAAGWVLWASPVSAQEAPLVIRTERGYPPDPFLAENGKATGYNVDLAEAIARVMQLDIEVGIGPRAGIRQALEADEHDSALVAKLPGIYWARELGQPSIAPMAL